MKRAKLERWLASFATSNENRDDIHIDEIDKAFEQKSEWLRGASDTLATALALRVAHSWDMSLAMELYLSAVLKRTVPELTTDKEITQQLSHTPPQLAAYARGHEPWTHSPEAFVPLEPAYRPSVLPTVRILYQEWFDQEEQDYDRRLWWTD
jgi:hypothetical protein